MEAIVAWIVASPELFIGLVTEVVGIIVHAVLGGVTTVGESTRCLVAGEFATAGTHIVDETFRAVGERIDSATSNLSITKTIVHNAVTDFGEGIRASADTMVDQISHALSGEVVCPS